MREYFPRIANEAIRRSDSRGHIDILYESTACVLKRTFSRKGAMRGIHWQQPPMPQVKIFRIVQGRVADFVVDMNDPQRTIHHSIVGPADGWVRIEADLAHGFYALEDSIFEYFCDGGYSESSEIGFNIADDLRRILGVDAVELSAKDAAMPSLAPVSHVN